MAIDCAVQNCTAYSMGSLLFVAIDAIVNIVRSPLCEKAIYCQECGLRPWLVAPQRPLVCRYLLCCPKFFAVHFYGLLLLCSPFLPRFFPTYKRVCSFLKVPEQCGALLHCVLPMDKRARSPNIVVVVDDSQSFRLFHGLLFSTSGYECGFAQEF